LERLIGFDVQLLHDAAIMGISIFILFFGLSYLLFNPVRDVLKKRRERVLSELEDASTKSKDANELKALYESKLKDISLERDRILEDARKKAKLKEADIIAKAEQEAKIITQRADKEIELEKRKALDELKREIVDIASVMASKALSSSMDMNMQKALIDEALKGIGESTWQN
jgi:ATP synthase F0, B subunit